MAMHSFHFLLLAPNFNNSFLNSILKMPPFGTYNWQGQLKTRTSIAEDTLFLLKNM